MKGDVVFEVEDEQYRLVVDFNAVCDLEGVLGPDIPPNGPRAVRAVMWAALQRHHPGTTLLRAGELIQAIGPTEAATLTTRAMTESGLAGGDGSAAADPRAAAAKPPKPRASKAP
jgi:hypothetical protein